MKGLLTTHDQLDLEMEGRKRTHTYPAQQVERHEYRVQQSEALNAQVCSIAVPRLQAGLSSRSLQISSLSATTASPGPLLPTTDELRWDETSVNCQCHALPAPWEHSCTTPCCILLCTHWPSLKYHTHTHFFAAHLSAQNHCPNSTPTLAQRGFYTVQGTGHRIFTFWSNRGLQRRLTVYVRISLLKLGQEQHYSHLLGCARGAFDVLDIKHSLHQHNIFSFCTGSVDTILHHHFLQQLSLLWRLQIRNGLL